MTTLLRRMVSLAIVSLGVSAALAQDQAAKAAPDLLIFTNGDQLQGKLVRGVGQSIVFKSDMAGEITVPLDKVKELRAGGSFAVLRKDVPILKQSVHPGSLRVDQGYLTTNDEGGSAAVAVPVASVGYIIDRKTYDHDLRRSNNPFTGWNGAVNAGLTLLRSTQNGSTYNAGIALIRVTPAVAYIPRRDRTTLDFNETYGKITQPTIPQTNPPTPDAIAKTSILHADLERDEYLSPRFYYLGETAFDHNFSQGLDLQQLYGAGVGWTPIQRPAQQLDLKLDAHYEKQQFQATASNQNLIGSVFAEAYRRTLPRKILLTQTTSIIPAWNNLNAYAANGSVVLTLPTFHRLGVNLTTTDSFINNPAPGFKKNSFQFITGLSYTLR